MIKSAKPEREHRTREVGGSDSPLITIITVCYNCKDCIGRTILSIKNQDFKKFEYIIIDGGSTDGTAEIIKANFEVVDFYLSEPDTGIYNAMNKGIGKARGEWVNFLNAGDIYASNDVLSRVAGELYPGVDVVYGDRNYVTGERSYIQPARPVETIYEKMPFCHQAAFASTRALKQFAFNETYRFAADYDLFIRMYRSGRSFQKVNITVCDFLAGGLSESGLRPSIEAVKILLDNIDDERVIRKNAYVAEFESVVRLWCKKLDISGDSKSHEGESRGDFLQKQRRRLQGRISKILKPVVDKLRRR